MKKFKLTNKFIELSLLFLIACAVLGFVLGMVTSLITNCN